jgi:hypothetical protein
VPCVVHPVGNRDELELVVGHGREHGPGVGVIRVEPLLDLLVIKDEGHAVVDRPHGRVGRGVTMVKVSRSCQVSYSPAKASGLWSGWRIAKGCLWLPSRFHCNRCLRPTLRVG